MMPAQGAWGVWYLPGSKEFHVAWTGVVEFLAGLWLTIGAVSTAIFGISLPDAFQLGTGIMCYNVIVAYDLYQQIFILDVACRCQRISRFLFDSFPGFYSPFGHCRKYNGRCFLRPACSYYSCHSC